MVQLENLWQFMQVDMEADKFEATMRQSPNRQQLIKQRNFLMEQQNNMKKLESDVLDMQDRLEAIKDEAQRLEGVLASLSEEVAQNPPKTIEEADQKSDAARKLAETLLHYEQELQKMRKDAEARDRQQKEIRVRAAKTKQEYDALKLQYDQEFKRDTETLNGMRANIEKEAAKLDPELLKRYRSIKQHCTPPMAKLVNGQCSGCFMSLPSATLREMKLGERTVECDNCGRILYDPK